MGLPLESALSSMGALIDWVQLVWGAIVWWNVQHTNVFKFKFIFERNDHEMETLLIMRSFVY